MLWYGQNQSPNFKKIYKTKLYRCNLFTKTLAFNVIKHNSLSYTNLFIYIPVDWNLILLKSIKNTYNTKLLYFFSPVYFFKISILNVNLRWFYNIQTSTLLLTNTYTSNFYKLYLKQIVTIFHSFSKLFFFKIKI